MNEDVPRWLGVSSFHILQESLCRFPAGWTRFMDMRWCMEGRFCVMLLQTGLFWRDSLSRKQLQPDRKEGIMSTELFNVADIFGENVFNDTVIQARLPKKVYKNLKKTIE